MLLPKCLNLLVFLEIGLGLVLDIVVESATGVQSQHTRNRSEDILDSGIRTKPADSGP